VTVKQCNRKLSNCQNLQRLQQSADANVTVAAASHVVQAVMLTDSSARYSVCTSSDLRAVVRTLETLACAVASTTAIAVYTFGVLIVSEIV
jgi:hypothetical protein